MSKSTWNSDADQDLLFSIMTGDEVSRPSPNWEKVTAIMQELGYTFTKQAIRQHFAKKLWAPFEERRSGEKDPSTPSPVKKVKKTPSSSQKMKKTVTPRATPSKRSKPAIEEEDEDDLFEVVTPTKKPKVEKEAKMEGEEASEH